MSDAAQGLYSEVFISGLTKGGAQHYGYKLQKQMEASGEYDKQEGADKTANDRELVMNNLVRDEELIHLIYEHIKGNMQISSTCEFEEFLSEKNFQINTLMFR